MARVASRKTKNTSLPAAAQCAVELDKRQRLVLLRGGQVELSGKQVRVRGQHFQIACRSAAIANARQRVASSAAPTSFSCSSRVERCLLTAISALDTSRKAPRMVFW